ncbi:hypothetical protein GE09DRAFT_1214409 [Coniochaeta sp. 2T2.1]|nr:hypothetical protein GE09DRAFT_1214409 [Coniochaeta sp. 2T2.1]
MASQRRFDLVPKTTPGSVNDTVAGDSAPLDQQDVQSSSAIIAIKRPGGTPGTDAQDPRPIQTAPDAATAPTSTEASSGAHDPHPAQLGQVPQITVTSPAEETSVTSPSKPKRKGIQISNYVTEVSETGEERFVLRKTSQTKLPVSSLDPQTLQDLPLPSCATEQITRDRSTSAGRKQGSHDHSPSSATEQNNSDASPSSAGEQTTHSRPTSSATEQSKPDHPPSSSASEQNPDLRPQPSLCTFAEYLKDESNLPESLRPEIPPKASSEQDLAESSEDESNLPAHLQPVSLKQILAEGPPADTASSSGLKRSVTKRVAQKIQSLVSPSSKRPDTPLPSTTTSILPTEEKKDDEQKAQSKQEAKTSISSQSDTLPTPPPLSHHPLFSATTPPLPLPSHNRGRSPNVTIRPDYELLEPFVARARMSSKETRQDTRPLTNIATMSTAESSTTGPHPIPLVCPAWDRVVDLTWSREADIPWSGARELTAFRVSLAQFHREAKRTPSTNDLSNPLFQLPDKVRYMICKYLVPDGPGPVPIKLNNGMRLYDPAWPAIYFDTLANVLSSVANYTAVCWAMRADVLVTILNTRAFHVVFSPFSGPLLDPLAFSWFGKYAGYIQRLTIELDMTKLGFGQQPGAAGLNPLVKKKLLPRVEEYAVAAKRRGIFQDLTMNPAAKFFGVEERDKARAGGGGVSTVHSLTVAVRRYYGERPAEAGGVSQKYVPDEYLAVLGPVKALCGKVDVLRAVGLDPDSTHRLFALVRAAGPVGGSSLGATDGRLGTVSSRCPSDFYPPLPVQASFFDDGTGKAVLVRHPFALVDGRVGFYLDENMVAQARKGTGGVWSYVEVPAGAVLGKAEPAAMRARGLSGLVAGREKEKDRRKSKEAEMVKEEAPEWPEEKTEEKQEETKSGGSTTETEQFPKQPDEELQLALMETFELSERMGALVERCPSPERQQDEAAEDTMPGSRRSSSGGSGVVGRVTGRIQRGMSQLNLKGGASKE